MENNDTYLNYTHILSNGFMCTIFLWQGARLLRDLFSLARMKKSCVIFFDEIDAIGGARYNDGGTGDNEVHRTMLELINQLDGFDARGNIKVSMSNTVLSYTQLVISSIFPL